MKILRILCAALVLFFVTQVETARANSFEDFIVAAPVFAKAWDSAPQPPSRNSELAGKVYFARQAKDGEDCYLIYGYPKEAGQIWIEITVYSRNDSVQTMLADFPPVCFEVKIFGEVEMKALLAHEKDRTGVEIDFGKAKEDIHAFRREAALDAELLKGCWGVHVRCLGIDRKERTEFSMSFEAITAFSRRG